MTNRIRSGSIVPAAFSMLLAAYTCGAGAQAADAPTAPTAEAVATDTSSLLLDIKPVLNHDYAGIDTNALLARIQERQKWGEKDERLIEAEGILHWDRGDVHLALPCFKRLTNPGVLAMGLMAEGLLAQGDRYEAAGWFLKSARAAKDGDPIAVAMFKRYLEIKPADTQAELQLALCLEKQLRYPEAAEIYLKHSDPVAKNPQATLRVGALLVSQGKTADAATLFELARKERPDERDLCERLAEARELLGQKLEAARSWTDAWALDASDSTARDRAIAQLEGAGAAGEAPLEALLENALLKDKNSAALHFKLAVLQLRHQDNKAAYSHLESALKASPGNPEYLARLPEAIEGDSLILLNFPLLKAKYEKEGVSLHLALLVARGFSLNGDKAKACRAWAQIAAISPKQLEGRRDAFLDFAACGDPVSLALASGIGEKQLAAGFNRDAARAMVQIDLRRKDFAKAAGHAGQLAGGSPQDAPMALTAAKAMLDAGKSEEAKQVLLVISKHAPSAEASLLLGRIQFASQEYAPAAAQFLIAKDSFPEAGRLRGDCLAELKDYPGAAAEYEAHYARSGDKESLRAVARMYREAHLGPKEAEVLETLIAKGWAGDDEKLRMADLKAAEGANREALALYDELLRNRSTLPAGEGWNEAALLLGTQSARDGQLDKAIKVLTLGLKNPPASLNPQVRAEAWNRLGECLAEKHQLKEALSAYASALAADSQSGEAAGELVRVATQLDAKKEMGEGYRALYRLDTANEEANAYLAAMSQAAREYKDAALHYRLAVQSRPNDAKAWENLGNALAMVPDLKSASGPLQTAIDLGAQSDEVYINRARAYRLEGSKDMAASILEFLLNRNPHDFLAMLWSAKFAEEDGNQNMALELFKKSAKLSAPRSPWPELISQGVLEAKVSSVSQD